MVPDSFTAYFTATASAAGALIGLLFVAISLRPDSVFGEKASARGRALAGSSFTGLVNGFFLSLTALIPGTNLGVSAAILAVFALTATLKLQKQVGGSQPRLLLTLLAVVTFLAQLGEGIGLIASPHKSGLVTNLAWVTITSLAVALMRAWLLMQGRHIETAG